MFQAPKLTNAGKDLYYRNMGSEPIKFTTIQMGSGNLSGPIATMTALVNPLVTINASVKKNADYVEVSGKFSNASIQTGFYWREIGIFAANPADPNNRAADILYCYQNAYDTADYIPVASIETVEKNITVPVIVEDAANVSCTLSGSLVMASMKDLDDHSNDTTKHVGATTKATPVDADSMVLVDSADGNKQKRLSWSAIKNALSSVFAAASHNHSGTYEPAITKKTAFNVDFETTVENIKKDGTASVGSLGTAARADHVHPQDSTKANMSTIVAMTISAASWSGTTAPFTYTFSNAKITTTNLIELIMGDNITKAQIEMMQAANIQGGAQNAGSIVLNAWGDKPTVDLPVKFIIRGDL